MNFIRHIAVISALLPHASGSCLPEAVPVEQRQNLVNPNGETYPVGVYISAYAASYAAQHLGAILIEEKLGYKTKLNTDAVGSGTVAGYYGVTGCRTPNDVNDRGCMQGVTYYHVHFESWWGYVSDWNSIRKNYASMAPINKGSMGYVGLATMYVPRPNRDEAYSTDGKALEFYRNWNYSWNEPWKYSFKSISDIDTADLMACSASVMSDDPSMQRHVTFTGDTDGVVIAADGKHSGRCDDGFWWLPPSCRGTPSHCVPWVTGGTGWAAEEFMQKYVIFNMPVAIGVAANWGKYTTVPATGDMTFYWWTPDPSFLDLNPMVVNFPANNARERTANILTSEASGAPINTLVSADLSILAPMVEKFADNVQYTLSQMDDILRDQKNTGDSWENVTCRWILANRDIWSQWIPDESECYPGFGMFDSVLNEFTDTRINVTNKIVCQACPPGTFSQKVEDGKEGGSGETYMCVPCEPGTSQASGAQMSCKPCKSGEYVNETGSKECNRCAFGSYQDQEGQLGCKLCPAANKDLITLGFGSIALSDCGCPETYIDMDPTGDFDCVECSTGMYCPALSSLVDLENGNSTNGELYTPNITKGYYSTIDAPTEVYQCQDGNACPGGPPGRCGGGLIGIPCSECAEGFTFTGSQCEDCGGWRQFLWGLAVCCIFGFLTLAYYLTTSKVTAKATVLFATTASFGMLVMSMQNLGLVGMMTVEWPDSLKGLFSVCQFLLLDIDSYGFSCVAGQNEPVRYLLSALIFPIGVVWLALGCAVSRIFPKKYHWEVPKVVSTMGAFLQVGFSTMSATALAPMMCYQHPNGLRSILKYPGVICGSDEHSTMLAIAWVLLVVFVFGFVALCAYSVYMVMQMLAWPWKVPMLNLTDCIISFCIVLLVTTSTLYLNKIDSIDDTMYGFAAGVSTAMLSGIGAAVGVMVLMTSSALFYRSAMGGQKELAFFNLGRVATSAELSKKVKDMAAELEKTEQKDLAAKLAALSVFDTIKVSSCITLLATEVAPPAEDGRSFKFNKRIASASFDPSLKRKPQSRRSEDSRGKEVPVVEASIVAVEDSNAPSNAPQEVEEVKTQWI